jgi:hypothetical protein
MVCTRSKHPKKTSKDVQEFNMTRVNIESESITDSLLAPFIFVAWALSEAFDLLPGLFGRRCQGNGTLQRNTLTVDHQQPLRAPEKGKSKPKEIDLAYYEGKFPGFSDFLYECGLEAERLYSAVKGVGLTGAGDMEKKWKTAVLDRFGDGRDFRHIKKEYLEDKRLYEFPERQGKRKFIGDLLRKMVLLGFSSIEKKKQAGQRLSGPILYGLYKKKKIQAKSP